MITVVTPDGMTVASIVMEALDKCHVPGKEASTRVIMTRHRVTFESLFIWFLCEAWGAIRECDLVRKILTVVSTRGAEGDNGVAPD